MQPKLLPDYVPMLVSAITKYLMRFVVPWHFLRVGLAVVLFQAALSAVLHAATFTVINTADAGPGSLRVAISNANFSAGSDLINFAIPGTGPFTINLATVLPSLVEPVTIDGTTQAGYVDKPLVALDGVTAAGHGSGIFILTSNSVVRGLSLRAS